MKANSNTNTNTLHTTHDTLQTQIHFLVDVRKTLAYAQRCDKMTIFLSVKKINTTASHLAVKIYVWRWNKYFYKLNKNQSFCIAIRNMPPVKSLSFCEKCGRGFTRKVHLNTHKKEVHNQEPFVFIYRCKTCGADYKYKKNWQQHVRKIHTESSQHQPLKKKIVNPSLSNCFVKLAVLDQRYIALMLNPQQDIEISRQQLQQSELNDIAEFEHGSVSVNEDYRFDDDTSPQASPQWNLNVQSEEDIEIEGEATPEIEIYRSVPLPQVSRKFLMPKLLGKILRKSKYHCVCFLP